MPYAPSAGALSAPSAAAASAAALCTRLVEAEQEGAYHEQHYAEDCEEFYGADCCSFPGHGLVSACLVVRNSISLVPAGGWNWK